MKKDRSPRSAESDGISLRKCLAHIYQVPLESVPEFRGLRSEYWGIFQRWLLQYHKTYTAWVPAFYPVVPTGVHLLVGARGDQGIDHYLVGEGAGITHDPTPDLPPVVPAAYLLFIPWEVERDGDIDAYIRHFQEGPGGRVLRLNQEAKAVEAKVSSGKKSILDFVK